MFSVVDPFLVSRHRTMKAAGKAALDRMTARVIAPDGKDVTFTAKDAANSR